MPTPQAVHTRDQDRGSSKDHAEIELLRKHFQIQKAILGATELSSTDKLVAIVILSHRSNTTGKSWPSAETIAIEASLNRRTVTSALERLRSVGVITWDHRKTSRGLHNVYRFQPVEPWLDLTSKGCVTRYRFKPGVEAPLPATGVEAPLPAAGVEAPLPGVDVGALTTEAPGRDPGSLSSTQGPGVVSTRVGILDRRVGIVSTGVGIQDPTNYSENSGKNFKEEREGQAPSPKIFLPKEPEKKATTSTFNVFLEAYREERKAKYGYVGKVDPISPEQKQTIVEAVDELITLASTDGTPDPERYVCHKLIKFWFRNPGRENHLRDRMHPFRCIINDLDEVSADFLRERKILTRRPPPEADWQTDARASVAHFGQGPTPEQRNAVMGAIQSGMARGSSQPVRRPSSVG